MIKTFVYFFRKLFPLLSVVFLWRMQSNFWNPGGILAIIPIFYYSFVRPVPWFPLVSILFCFLIDYSFDTKLFWVTMYFIAYTVNGFQYFLDLQRADKNALVPFMIFFGVALFVLMVINMSWTGIWRCGEMFVFVSVLYVPITNLVKRVHGDD